MAATAAARPQAVDVGPEHRPDGASLVPLTPLPAHADGANVSDENQSRGASSHAGESADGGAPASTAPAVLRDLLLAVARTALAAEGCSLPAWARLSLVCGAWRCELAGGPLANTLQDSRFR